MWTRVEWGIRILQTVLWVCMVPLGLLIIIPLAIVKGDFLGRCSLYSKAKWTGIHVVVTTGDAGSCTFVFGVTGVLVCGYGLLQAVVNIKQICKERRGQDTSSPGCCKYIIPVFNACCAGFIMVAAALISIGLRLFCNQLTAGKEFSCSQSQFLIKWHDNPLQKGLNGDRFFNYTTFAVIAAWTCFLVMLLQTGVSIYQGVKAGCCRKGQGQEDSSNLPKAEMAAPVS